MTFFIHTLPTHAGVRWNRLHVTCWPIVFLFPKNGKSFRNRRCSIICRLLTHHCRWVCVSVCRHRQSVGKLNQRRRMETVSCLHTCTVHMFSNVIVCCSFFSFFSSWQSGIDAKYRCRRGVLSFASFLHYRQRCGESWRFIEITTKSFQ